MKATLWGAASSVHSDKGQTFPRYEVRHARLWTTQTRTQERRMLINISEGDRCRPGGRSGQGQEQLRHPACAAVEVGERALRSGPLARASPGGHHATVRAPSLQVPVIHVRGPSWPAAAVSGARQPHTSTPANGEESLHQKHTPPDCLISPGELSPPRPP